jgi:hypothetical protein
MKKLTPVLLSLILATTLLAQQNVFEPLNFVIGTWQGTGSGFGNATSKISSEFNVMMGGKYIEIKNDSKFEPTDKKPEGENHIDWGMVSYDKSRKKIIYRQFNIEGYINQYVLNDSLTNDSKLVFETETIENFISGGKARWTVKKKSDNEIETIFDVSFPGKEFACYGTNILKRKE